MTNQNKDEIDPFQLLRVVTSNIKKFTAIFICLSIVFLWLNQNKINVNYELKLIETSPSISVYCYDKFTCKANLMINIIKKYTKKFDIKNNEKNNSLIFSWSGDIHNLKTLNDDIAIVQSELDDWLINDFRNYQKIVLNKNSTPQETELYTRIYFLSKIGPIFF